ncbi:MAG: aminotransferase class V-fold PLP-dependent enzyme [Erysipelotrichales bacterium]|nr:aminotransferase class V-fold PLP-dependent enzyme [Erysipelotrichales bacterium]
MIYLDYAAHHPVKEEVLFEFNKIEMLRLGNSNSSHTLGIEASLLLDNAIGKLFKLLNLNNSEYEIIHVSSATEANNLAIKGVANSYKGFGKHILVSHLEHNSVNACLSYLKDHGFEIEFVENDENGKISLGDLKSKIRKDTILVIVTLEDSETGIIQDYENIASVIKEHENVHLLMDVTQAMGKFDINYDKIDMFTFSGHKFGGLLGSGFLVKRKDIVLTPLIHGGTSQSIYRGGSVPVSLICSSIRALELEYNDKDINFAHVLSLKNKLINAISDNKCIIVNSSSNPYIINLSIKNKKGHDVVKKLNEMNICVSQKSACSIPNTPSKIIMAMYHDKNRALSSFRISLSYLTKKEEIDELIKALEVITNE